MYEISEELKNFIVGIRGAYKTELDNSSKLYTKCCERLRTLKDSNIKAEKKEKYERIYRELKTGSGGIKFIESFFVVKEEIEVRFKKYKKTKKISKSKYFKVPGFLVVPLNTPVIFERNESGIVMMSEVELN